MGSKARISKEILPIILKNRSFDQWYVEPFVGGANLIDKVDGNRKGSDVNEFLISTLKALQLGWEPPLHLSELEYLQIKNNPTNYPSELVGFVGFACSYAAKWFGGYCRGFASNGEPRNYIVEAYKNVVKQKSKLGGIVFENEPYHKVMIPDNSIIYCDPPYANTTSYRDAFEHSDFWQWCRDKTCEGHSVFVSEYSAPSDFICIWSRQIASSLTADTGSKSSVEKLFTLKTSINLKSIFSRG